MFNKLNEGFYFLNKLQLDYNKKIYLYEIDSSKNKKQFNLLVKDLNEYKIAIENFNDSNKGFNINGFVLTLCITHLSFIYKKRIVLHQMEKSAIKYIISLVGFSSFIGYFSGNFILGRSFKLKLMCMKMNKEIDKKLNEIKTRSRY